MRRASILLLLLAGVAAAPAQAQGPVTICHATGNPDRPYVEMTLSGEGVIAHVGHEDDLVPAPAGGCPATEVVLPEDTPAATTTPQYAVPTPTATAAPTATPRPGRERDRDRDGEGDEAGVQGGGSGGDRPTQSASRRAVQVADTRHLPLTGAEMWLIAAAGVGLLLCGSGIRVLSSAAGRPPGPSGR